MLAQAEVPAELAAAEHVGSSAAVPAAGTPAAELKKPLAEAAQSVLDTLGPTFSETPWQGWVVFLVAVFGGVIAGKLVQTGLRHLADRADARNWRVRAVAIRSAAAPVNLALISLGLFIGMTPLKLAPRLGEFANQAFALLWLTVISWLLFNLVDLVDLGLRSLVARTHQRVDDEVVRLVVPMFRRALRLVVVVLSVLFVAENVFEANIAAWLTGLGIAGLAVSLAAQDPIKNFFGSLVVVMDRPFAVGHRIIFMGVDGVVETVGFRSTRIRTLAGHLVTVPNMKFTDTIVENVSARGGIRRTLNLAIPSSTPPQNVEQAIAIVREVLTDPSSAGAPRSPAQPPHVVLGDISAGALTIHATYWFGVDGQESADEWRTRLDHADRVNQTILRRLGEAGIRLA